MANYYDFTSFQNYTLGCGVLKELRRITLGYGRRYLIMLDHHVTDELVHNIENSLTRPLENFTVQADNPLGRAAGLMDNLPHPDPNEIVLDYEFYRIPGRSCSYQNAQTIGQKLKDYRPDVVVAVGGSKCLDLVRAALHYVESYSRPKLVLCPTLIASNASATGMSVIYDEETQQMVDFWSLAVMPECVIIDTALIIRTPVRALVAGIGDQISSSIEALHTLHKIGAWESCDPFCIAHHQTVLDVLRKHSVSAVQAMKRGEITAEFEWVCHALTRYTGPQLAVATAFFAHILDEALLGLPPIAKRMHGEIVGYGILPEMVAFGTPDEMYPWVELYLELGIPVNLEQLGLSEYRYADVLRSCEYAADKIMASRSLIRWQPAEMAEAVMEADRLVSDYLTRQ